MKKERIFATYTFLRELYLKLYIIKYKWFLRLLIDRIHFKILSVTTTVSCCFLFLQVNAHEQTRNEQGLFTYLYHWLIVTDQSKLCDIEDIVGNITHLSAISWETQQNNVVRCKFVFYLWKQETINWIILFLE